MKALVITAPGIRPDYLGCYGSDWVDTPNFDQLAVAGIVFDNHHAVQPDSEGAWQAWRSAVCNFPALHADSGASPLSLPPDVVTQLNANGVPTHLIAHAAQLSSQDLGQGWKTFRPCDSTDSLLKAIHKGILQLAKKENGLLWADIPVLLPPWQIPDDFIAGYFGEPVDDDGDEGQQDDEDAQLVPLIDPQPGVFDSLDDQLLLRLQHTYVAALTYLDAILGQILEWLADVDPDDKWLLIVTSQHGLSLGEHGLIDPARPWLHEERIHVPLILRLPGSAQAGRRVFALTQSVDVPSILLEGFNLPASGMQGHSLLALANGRQEPIRRYSCSRWQLGAEAELAIRTPNWKLILPLGESSKPPFRERQLYVKPDDRWEVNNVVQHHFELADELEKDLKELIAKSVRPPFPGKLELP
ncbi:MAG: sulfatase [Gemmataceae bacterium]